MADLALAINLEVVKKCVNFPTRPNSLNLDKYREIYGGKTEGIAAKIFEEGCSNPKFCDSQGTHEPMRFLAL